MLIACIINSDRFIEVKYNKIRQLGSLNGNCVRLIEVTA